MKFLEFKKNRDKEEPDILYDVHNKKGEFLGHIVEGYVGRKKRLKFEPDHSTFFTSECLQQIIYFMIRMEEKCKKK